MKQCTKCKEWKKLSEFYVKTKSKDGLQYQCKSCNRKHNKENKEHINEYYKEYNKKNKEHKKYKNNRICKILKKHADTLQDDDERLSTDFIKTMLYGNYDNCDTKD